MVARVEINDADQRVYAFWLSMLNQTQRFVDRIMTIPLTLDEWNIQWNICTNPNSYTEFEIGFAAFYMNRCNRSGVLTGAGPIGGYEQSGRWRLDVRFTRDALAERVIALGKIRSKILVSGLDAIDFLKTKLPRGTARNKCLVYLDPPYVIKGQRLYMNAYEPSDHKKVSRYLNGQKMLPWIMSYDDAPLIRNLYASRQLAHLPIRYSLQEKRFAKELIISPMYIRLPRSFHIGVQESAMCELSKGAAA